MLLLDYQNVLVQSLLTERFSGQARLASLLFNAHFQGSI